MKQYSFYDVDLIIDGSMVDGFPVGANIIAAGRNAAQHIPVMDAYGKLAVATSADQSGFIHFPLLQTSDWNGILYAKAQLTQATGLSGNKSLWTPMQIQLVDKMGDVLVEGTNGFIPKQPTVGRGVGITQNMWSIFVEVLNTECGSYPTIGN
ncbi:hypothetical protein I6H07_06120 [Hafnia alvei]|nr:hypothetical protein [Hafnia alvei]MBI0275410.1 hypothetical protein [Hafnia alvei]PNK98595.1 hypothetical protein CEQ28_013875 [Hafnia alvei]